MTNRAFGVDDCCLELARIGVDSKLDDERKATIVNQLQRGVKWAEVLSPENEARNSLAIEPNLLDMVIIGIDRTTITCLEPSDELITLKCRNVCAVASRDDHGRELWLLV